ncbi:hypothetical protein LTR84_003621 [Exophiala bonariae]|uniref:CCHC-type domain-containing protein n=1 Tax=Exophiala bonariae TaxID=1690606 RepID=A0AAV9N8J3_9EURO|nr:hypothetical protein LTR84_003621 [Exophiala bonariae]
MASPGFGNNRLVTGFHKTRVILAEQAALAQQNQSAPPSTTSSPGASAEDAIEISDDESSSEGGGMLLNVDNAFRPQSGDVMVVDIDSQSEEEGELRESDPDHSKTAAEILISNQNATDPRLLPNQQNIHVSRPDAHDEYTPRRLADLSEHEFELQTRYVFTSLKRDEIDLAWPAFCLGCLKQGHMKETCPEILCKHCGLVGEHPARLCPSVTRCTRCRERGHSAVDCDVWTTVTATPCDLCGGLGHPEPSCPERFFPSRVQSETGPLELWISCCNCASKSHYVGDCPDLGQSFVTSWSTRSISQKQIINLSLGSNMQELEAQAGNRGLRPQGLSIKGRAGLHHAGNAGGRPSDNNSSEDEFLRPRIGTGQRNQPPRHDFSFRAPERLPPPASRPGDAGYDRYNPPSTSLNQRPRNDWYATDSFGQQRPKSPGPEMSQSHRGNGANARENFRRRSRSPHVLDGSRMDRVRPPLPAMKGAISINLPVRRGSNDGNGSPTQATGVAKTGNSHTNGGVAQSAQNDRLTGSTGAMKMTSKKSKQTKAATRPDQVDNNVKQDSSDMTSHPQPNRAMDTAPSQGAGSEDGLPPEAILRQFVDAMNVHRESIGRSLLILERYGGNQEGKPKFSLIDRTRPCGQRRLKIDQRRGRFIWQWSKTPLPEILRHAIESTHLPGNATATEGPPLDRESILLASLVPESRAFLNLFGAPASAPLSNTQQPCTERDATSKEQLLESDKLKSTSNSKFIVRRPSIPPERPVWDNGTKNTLVQRDVNDPLGDHEFNVYLDLFNAPRFDLGMGPVFLKYKERCFYFVDSAVLDYSQHSIPVNGAHTKDIWTFLRAYPTSQKKARLEVTRRLEALSHPVDPSLTREAAERVMEGILPPNTPTRAMSAIPGGDYKDYTDRKRRLRTPRFQTARVTRSQGAKLRDIDYGALEEAERTVRRRRRP